MRQCVAPQRNIWRWWKDILSDGLSEGRRLNVKTFTNWLIWNRQNKADNEITALSSGLYAQPRNHPQRPQTLECSAC